MKYWFYASSTGEAIAASNPTCNLSKRPKYYIGCDSCRNKQTTNRQQTWKKIVKILEFIAEKPRTKQQVENFVNSIETNKHPPAESTF